MFVAGNLSISRIVSVQTPLMLDISVARLHANPRAFLCIASSQIATADTKVRFIGGDYR